LWVDSKSSYFHWITSRLLYSILHFQGYIFFIFLSEKDFSFERLKIFKTSTVNYKHNNKWRLVNKAMFYYFVVNTKYPMVISIRWIVLSITFIRDYMMVESYILRKKFVIFLERELCLHTHNAIWNEIINFVRCV